MKYVASCSYGKDSMAMVLLALERNLPLDEVIYCEVMFANNISGEHPEHREFIYSTAVPFLKSVGIKSTIIKSKRHTWISLSSCYQRASRRGIYVRGLYAGSVIYSVI